MPSEPTALSAAIKPVLDPASPEGLAFIRTAPLTFGAWGELKRSYKTLEAEPNLSAGQQNALAGLIARIDAALLTRGYSAPNAQINNGQSYVGDGAFAVRDKRGLFFLGERYSRGNERLQTVDFSTADLLAPRLGTPLSFKQDGEGKQIVWIAPDFAAVRTKNDRLLIVDLSDFDQPKLRGTLGGQTLGLVVKNALSNLQSIASGGKDGLIYAACDHKTSDSFLIIRASDPDAPQIVGIACASGRIAGVHGSRRAVCRRFRKRFAAGITAFESLMGRMGLQTQKKDTRYVCLVDVSQSRKPPNRFFFAR